MDILSVGRVCLVVFGNSPINPNRVMPGQSHTSVFSVVSVVSAASVVK